MLPEVEKFFKAYNDTTPMTIEEFQVEMDTAYAKLRQEVLDHPRSGHYSRLREFSYVVEGAAEGNFEARKTRAWADLEKETEDPIAKYLASSHASALRSDYSEYVQDVLKMLPATLEELDSHANEHGWCDRYDSIVLRVQRAGHLPSDDFVGDSKTRQNLRDFFGEFTVRRVNIRKLFSLVDEIIAEETAKKPVTETVAAEADAS